MKIVYVARHGGQGNDDEGAVAHALTLLGHEVVRVEEGAAYGGRAAVPGADFCLFNKWAGAGVRVGCPKVFWFWDKVCDEPGDVGPVAVLTAQRQRWMARTLADPELLCGFCTDGDWVAADTTGKLVWLTQGFDERQAGLGTFRPELAHDLAFFGTASRNGLRRQLCLEALRERYGKRLWVLDKETRSPLHGRALADLCVSAKVVVAPDGPSTDRYWSNRVYLVTGLGGCLVHPRCASLSPQYHPEELLTYGADMIHCVDFLLESESRREGFRERGHERTMAQHLYRHRCEKLVEEVRRRLCR